MVAARRTYGRHPKRGARCRAALLLAVALLLAAIGACSGEGPSGPLGRGVYIAEGWQTTREVIGHKVHVLREKVPCAKCHEMTDDSIGPVTPGRCGACHEKQARIEHAATHARERFGAEAKADCTACHAFTPSSAGAPGEENAVYEATDCNRCHAKRQGDTPAVRVHGDSDCLQCHRPHEDAKPTPAPCVDCHRDVQTTHAAEGKSATAVCTTCHSKQHAPASDARPGCAACHAKEKPIVGAAALFPGHPECVGCHRPHELARADAVPCRSCHADMLVLGAPRVRQHEQCSSCHSPHDVKGSPEAACATCHAGVHSNHPKSGPAGTCVGCHDPHPSSPKSRARSCSDCHQTARSEKSFHGGTECTKCHQPHEFVRQASDRRGCEACHAKQLGQVASIAGHKACEGCHGGLPHRPTTLGSKCESCHGREQKQVTKGHAKCTGCHEPHGGSVGAACQTCHQEEQKTSPRGHQDCQKCHEAHTGSPAKTACASCHAAEAKTKHGGSVPSCNTCHRAHGPGGVARPPACATCHAVAQLPGLHQKAKHQECGKCHSGHGEELPSAARAACLGCHADRASHFPDAPRCASCHLFDKSR